MIDHKNIDWTKTLVTSITFLLSLFEMVCWVRRNAVHGITLLFSIVLSSTIWPQLRLLGLRLSQAAHLIKTGGHFVVSKEITIYLTIALFSVALAFSTHLCVVCRYFAVLCRFFKAISLQCRNLAQQGLKKLAKTSVINGDATKVGATQNTTVVWAWLPCEQRPFDLPR